MNTNDMSELEAAIERRRLARNAFRACCRRNWSGTPEKVEEIERELADATEAVKLANKKLR